MDNGIRAFGKPFTSAERDFLFRFPGPTGFKDFTDNGLTHLAPRDMPYLYLFFDRHEDCHTGIGAFGAFAVCQPESFGTVHVTDAAFYKQVGFTLNGAPWLYLGVNRAVVPEDFVWIPPRAMQEAHRAGDFSQAVDISRGGDIAELRKAVNDYHEEVAQLEKSGLTLPPQPWFKLPPDWRQDFLKRAGIPPRWSTA